MPVEEIVAALDRVEAAIVERQVEILRNQVSGLLNRAEPLLQAGDIAGVAALTWSAGVELQGPIVACWSAGWELGSSHMIREMRAAVPSRLAEVAQSGQFSRFATKKQLQAVRDLLVSDRGAPINLEAEQAVLRRANRLAGKFSDDQLGRLKVDLISFMSPDSTGKTLSHKELKEQIQANLQVGEARATSIARTELTDAYNVSRVKTATSSTLVTHLRFLAISDDRTTPICRSRNGMLIPVEDEAAIAANKPALHVRCRSTLSPIMGTINPRHREMVADPERDYKNRDLVPLPKGWLTDALPPTPKTGPDPTPAPTPKAKESKPRSHTDFIKSGKKAAREWEKEVKSATTDLEKTIKAKEKTWNKVAGKIEKIFNQGKEIPDTLQAEFEEAQSELTIARKALEMKQDNLFREFRNSLREGSKLSLADADRLAEAIKIDENLESKWTDDSGKTHQLKISDVAIASTLRRDASEFFRLTNGMGASSVKEFTRTRPRAYANRGGEINIGSGWSNTLWHELGHHGEFESDEILQASKSFVVSRASGAPQKLSELTGVDYGDSEVAYPDKFLDPYVGKVYADATEVVSMGVEHFSSYRNMQRLYNRDREHFYLMLGFFQR